MKYLKKLVIAISSLLLFSNYSCSYYRNYMEDIYIKKNYKKTDRLMAQKLEENGNVFSLKFDNNNFSYVFSKDKDGKTIWYELRKGKIVKNFQFTEATFDMKENDFDPMSIDLNCYKNNIRDYYLEFEQKKDLSLDIKRIYFFESLNLKCLDSIKGNNEFLNYISNIIEEGRPVIF